MQLAISKARGGYESSLDFGRTYSIFVSEPLTLISEAITMVEATPSFLPERSSDSTGSVPLSFLIGSA